MPRPRTGATSTFGACVAIALVGCLAESGAGGTPGPGSTNVPGGGGPPGDLCAGSVDPGRVTIHRLNRAEYNNTVRDLLDDRTQPAKDFPADDQGAGFDDIADVLSVS